MNRYNFLLFKPGPRTCRSDILFQKFIEAQDESKKESRANRWIGFRNCLRKWIGKPDYGITSHEKFHKANAAAMEYLREYK